MITIIIFFTALIAITGMIWHKNLELKKDKKFVLSRLASKTDHLFQTIYAKVRTFISYINKKTAIALTQLIAYHVLSWLRSVYIRAHAKAHAHPHSKKVIDMVRGKGQVHKTGGASFYLKSISEDHYAPAVQSKKV